MSEKDNKTSVPQKNNHVIPIVDKQRVTNSKPIPNTPSRNGNVRKK